MAITAGSGLLATVVMTGAMAAMKSRLPWYERYPLPPQLLTSRALQKLGVSMGARRRYARPLAAINHLGFGMTAGALYAPVTLLEANPALTGSLFGLAVWATSYLGWIPQNALLPSARYTPRRRSAVMIAAHLVWGLSLACLAQAALDQRRPTKAASTPAAT